MHTTKKRIDRTETERLALGMARAAIATAAQSTGSSLLVAVQNTLDSIEGGDIDRAIEYLTEYRERNTIGG